MSLKGPGVKGSPVVVLSGAGGTFKKWGLVESFRLLECALEGNHGALALPFPFFHFLALKGMVLLCHVFLP
jgi:hypothetical protein